MPGIELEESKGKGRVSPRPLSRPLVLSTSLTFPPIEWGMWERRELERTWKWQLVAPTSQLAFPFSLILVPRHL